jgi:hypothetical protein
VVPVCYLLQTVYQVQSHLGHVMRPSKKKKKKTQNPKGWTCSPVIEHLLSTSKARMKNPKQNFPKTTMAEVMAQVAGNCSARPRPRVQIPVNTNIIVYELGHLHLKGVITNKAQLIHFISVTRKMKRSTKKSHINYLLTERPRLISSWTPPQCVHDGQWSWCAGL